MTSSRNGEPRIETRQSRSCHPLGLACVWLVPLACAAESRGTAVAPSHSAASKAAPAVTPASQPTSAASAAPAAATITAAYSEPSPFVEGVRLGYAARLNIAGRRAFLTADNLLLALHDDGVQIDPALLEGMQQDLAWYPPAIAYYKNHGTALFRFVDDPLVPIDNSPTEREFQNGAKLRLNMLFAGSTEGAHRACVLLGIIATCRALRVPAQAYLVWAFQRLGTHRDVFDLPLEALTPAACKNSLG